jgi:hypothetical protein
VLDLGKRKRDGTAPRDQGHETERTNRAKLAHFIPDPARSRRKPTGPWVRGHNSP